MIYIFFYLLFFAFFIPFLTRSTQTNIPFTGPIQRLSSNDTDWVDAIMSFLVIVTFYGNAGG